MLFHLFIYYTNIYEVPPRFQALLQTWGGGTQLFVVDLVAITRIYAQRRTERDTPAAGRRPLLRWRVWTSQYPPTLGL